MNIRINTEKIYNVFWLNNIFYYTKNIMNSYRWNIEKRYPLVFIIILFLYFVYAFFRHLMDPLYGTIFQWLNLGIHEFWHIFFSIFGNTFLTILGWTLMQLIIPAIGLFFFWVQRDRFAISVAFAWLSTNFFNISTYCSDAIVMKLDLVSPGISDWIGDWTKILIELWILEKTYFIAWIFKFFAIVCMITFIILSWKIILERIKEEKSWKRNSTKRVIW